MFFICSGNICLAHASSLVIDVLENHPDFQKICSKNGFRISVDACFHIVKLIKPLQGDDRIESFLYKWCAALYGSFVFGGLSNQYLEEEEVTVHLQV